MAGAGRDRPQHHDPAHDGAARRSARNGFAATAVCAAVRQAAPGSSQWRGATVNVEMFCKRAFFSPRARRNAAILALSLLSALPGVALAQAAGSPGGGLPLVIGQGAGGTSYSVPIQTLLFFTALSFLPAVLL